MTCDPDHLSGSSSRRGFLIGGAASALALDASTVAAQEAKSGTELRPDAVPQGQAPQPAQVPAPGPQGYRFLTTSEVEALTAMADRLIPADDLGPGAVEAGVVTFIDRELGGQFGAAARWYMAGPWAEGAPSQGWQLALTPAQLYRIAFLSLDRWCLGARGKRFADLGPTDQDEVLTLLEQGDIDLEGVSSAAFFPLLWQNVVEGYLADPVYGGNRGMTGWRMLNFPGTNPALTEAVDLNGEVYRIDPVSIGA